MNFKAYYAFLFFFSLVKFKMRAATTGDFKCERNSSVNHMCNVQFHQKPVIIKYLHPYTHYIKC